MVTVHESADNWQRPSCFAQRDHDLLADLDELLLTRTADDLVPLDVVFDQDRLDDRARVAKVWRDTTLRNLWPIWTVDQSDRLSKCRFLFQHFRRWIADLLELLAALFYALFDGSVVLDEIDHAYDPSSSRRASSFVSAMKM